jgi:hypothetical protein
LVSLIYAYKKPITCRPAIISSLPLLDLLRSDDLLGILLPEEKQNYDILPIIRLGTDMIVINRAIFARIKRLSRKTKKTKKNAAP